jgi:hypothetical protein
MSEKDTRIRRLRSWARTPAGMWILFALGLGATFLILTLASMLSYPIR